MFAGLEPRSFYFSPSVSRWSSTRIHGSGTVKGFGDTGGGRWVVTRGGRRRERMHASRVEYAADRVVPPAHGVGITDGAYLGGANGRIRVPFQNAYRTAAT